jgi:nucleoid-associated protein YgaU
MRYNKRKLFFNGERLYENHFDARNVESIDHYATPIMRHPTADSIVNLQTLTHIWKQGDRYFKLAHKFYGDSKYWWVIAWFNKAPTESHLKLGDLITIPLPLRSILNTYGLYY